MVALLSLAALATPHLSAGGPEPQPAIESVELPPFVPVEARFPQWLSARQRLKSYLEGGNLCASFEVVGNMLHLDQDFPIGVAATAPEEYWPALGALFREMQALFRECTPEECFTPFRQREVRPELFRDLTAMLEWRDRTRTERGWPTLGQMLGHLCGIEPAQPAMAVVVRQTFTR